MYHTLVTLLNRLEQSVSPETSVIQWGAPVLSFGDVESSELATLGLNPSNREFVDEEGNELSGSKRRFPTLRSLQIESWKQADHDHLRQIIRSCKDYFQRNPYERWFSKLDDLLSTANCSYYDRLFDRSACHLDIVPYATSEKWGSLSHEQRTTLLNISVDTLGLVLRKSPVKVLILNGRAVVDHFEYITGVDWDVRKQLEWALPRSSGPDVMGVSFQGYVSEIGGITIGREVHVLGYNHNIQSSYGVSTEVLNSIRDWIGESIMHRIL